MVTAPQAVARRWTIAIFLIFVGVILVCGGLGLDACGVPVTVMHLLFRVISNLLVFTYNFHIIRWYSSHSCSRIAESFADVLIDIVTIECSLELKYAAS